MSRIEYVVFVEPQGYYTLPTPRPGGSWPSHRTLERSPGGKMFICIGPGRWGTNNPDLGVKIGYGDIYHTRALVELSGDGDWPSPGAFLWHAFLPGPGGVEYLPAGNRPG